MNRFLSVMALALCAGIALASPASARWVQEPLTWRTQNFSNVGKMQDTTFAAIGGGASAAGDTSSAFNTMNWQLPSHPAGNGDSIAIAYLVFSSDSSVAGGAAGNGALTIAGDVYPGATLGSIDRWENAFSRTVNFASGDYVMRLPLFYSTAYSTVQSEASSTTGIKGGLGPMIGWAKARLRISTTQAVPMARAWVVFWQSDSPDEKSAKR